jgi:enoyl-[acyl-carrier-protein] reductase (NADH)
VGSIKVYQNRRGKLADNEPISDTDEGTKKFIETTTPMKQAATPLEVIEPIIFFLESASLITGELLIIDSGLHLGGAPLKAR